MGSSGRRRPRLVDEVFCEWQFTQETALAKELEPGLGNNFRIGRYFNGAIGGVRVSKVARYDQNFTPPTQWQMRDADTLALYFFNEDRGETAERLFRQWPSRQDHRGHLDECQRPSEEFAVCESESEIERSAAGIYAALCGLKHLVNKIIEKECSSDHNDARIEWPC